MTLTIATAGSAVAAILEVTLWQYLTVAGAHPHIVFVGTVVWASVASFEGSLAWAFTGGLMLDILAPRPFGASAFVLLLVAGAAAAGARLLAQIRLRPLAPIALTVPLSIAYSLAIVLIVSAADEVAAPANAAPVLVPGAIFDAVVVTLVAVVVLAVRARREEQERVGW